MVAVTSVPLSLSLSLSPSLSLELQKKIIFRGKLHLAPSLPSSLSLSLSLADPTDLSRSTKGALKN